MLVQLLFVYIFFRDFGNIVGEMGFAAFIHPGKKPADAETTRNDDKNITATEKDIAVTKNILFKQNGFDIYLSGSDAIGGTHNAFFFHGLYNPSRPVVADAQLSLHV